MKKNSYLSVSKIKKSLEIGNASEIGKIIIRVKTENPEMMEISIFNNMLEKVDCEITQTSVKDDSWARKADNFKGYVEVNCTPTYTFEINCLKPDTDDELNLYCSFENADIEVVEKEKEVEEIILEKSFKKTIDGDEYEMSLKVVKTKNGLEGYLGSKPRGVDMDAYGKEDIVSRFHDDYMTEEVISLLKETLKKF